MQLIGLGGAFGSGKDTAAEMLAAYIGRRAHRIAFGDALKAEVREFLTEGRFDGTVWEHIRVRARVFLLVAHYGTDWTHADPGDKPTVEPMRALIQWWGTELRRAAQPDYWVQRFVLGVCGLPADAVVLVPDVRFHNEAALIRAHGGKLIQVERPSEYKYEAGINTHSSEVLARESASFDTVWHNAGGLEDLRQTVLAWLRAERFHD